MTEDDIAKVDALVEALDKCTIANVVVNELPPKLVIMGLMTNTYEWLFKIHGEDAGDRIKEFLVGSIDEYIDLRVNVKVSNAPTTTTTQ
jgi:hypothetical protein